MNDTQTATRGYIRRELNALARGEKRTWAQISALLQAIEDSEYWKDEASSFTDWIMKKQIQFGVKEASLWRYRSAARTYLNLARSVARKGDTFPELRELPARVSPENLELLSKLSRVVSQAQRRELFAGVLAGTVRRADLRARWETLRPALEGRTARGRNVQPPRVDPKALRARGAFFDATTIHALRTCQPTWTQVHTLERLAFFNRVRITRNDAPSSYVHFDAVALVKPWLGAAQYHGFAFRMPTLDNYERLSQLDDQIPYFDFFWLAVPASTDTRVFEKIDDRMPHMTHIGVLLVDGESIVVGRNAAQVPHEYYRADGRLVLASALLLRSLK